MLSSQTQVQQSSTHMMQTTRSGRPFVKDLHDLFSTLIISLPMETHRGLFKSYVNSFTAEEAIANLGSLKFTQSSRNLDPENPTRIITTTTTTTFSMVKDMAKSVCQTFLNAKLFETLSDPNSRSFKDKNVYGLTSKGTYILERFVSRNGITAPHLTKIFSSQKIPIRLFVVERNSETDSIILSKQNVESVFRRFAGSGPNIAGKDEEEPSITFAGRNIGIEVKERLFNNKKYSFGFSGMAACDWLCEFTTLITKEEAMRIATEFIRHGLLEPINDKVGDTKPKQSKQVSCLLFKYSKSIYYNISEEGRRLALWEYDGFHGDESKLNLLNEEESRTINSHRSSLNDHRESKAKKLQQILEDSNLCSLFMNFLKSTLCEENLLFLLDVREFKTRHSKNVNENGECRDPEEQKNLMIDAFKIYNTYLAPASPHELNIDSNLSKSMSQFMTSIDSKNDDDQRTPITDHLYDDIQDVIFRLMATDSMPKFIKTKEYLAYERGSEEVITSK